MTLRVLGVIAGLCASFAASQPDRTMRVDIHVAVEDEAGHPVRGMSPGDFSMLIDGAAHAIDSVAPAAKPTSVILLADTSISMKPFSGRLDGAAETLIDGLGGDDRWRTGAFGDRITFSRTFAVGRKSFQLAPRDPITVRERTVTGGSPIWDAVHQSVELLGGEPGRRSVVLFTDGRAGGNQFGLEEVAELSNDRQVSVTAVVPMRSFGVRQDRETIAVVSPAAGLDRLARYTGGVLLGGYDFKQDPLKQMQPLAARLRAGYALTFATLADGRRHRLDIRVRPPGLRVRAPMAFRASRN